MDDLEAIARFPCTDSTSLEYSNVFMKQSYRMKSRRFSVGLHEIVQSISNAPDSVQKPQSELQEGVADGCMLRRGKRLKVDGGFSIRDRVGQLLQQTSKETERAETVLLLKQRHGMVHSELFR